MARGLVYVVNARRMSLHVGYLCTRAVLASLTRTRLASSCPVNPQGLAPNSRYIDQQGHQCCDVVEDIAQIGCTISDCEIIRRQFPEDLAQTVRISAALHCMRRTPPRTHWTKTAKPRASDLCLAKFCAYSLTSRKASV